MRHSLLLSLAALFLASFAPTYAQEKGTSTATIPSEEAAKAPAGSGTETKDQAKKAEQKALEKKSAKVAEQAERLSKLKASIEADEKSLAELQAKLDNPQSEFRLADEALQKAKKQLQEKKEEIAKLVEAGKSAEAQALQAELEPLETSSNLANERFKIAFEEDKALKEQVRVVAQKLAEQKQALDRLLGAGETPPVQPVTPVGDTTKAAEGQPTTTPVSPIPGVPLPGAAPAGQETPPQATKEKALTPEVLEARKKEAEKKAAAEDARKEVLSGLETISAVKKTIELEKQLADTQRRKAENSRATVDALEADLQKKLEEGAPESELSRIRGEIRNARQRLREAVLAAENHAKLLEQQHTELVALQAQQIELLRQREEAEEAAKEATEEVEGLLNPYTPRNLLQWLINHGPRILFIVLGLVLLSRLSAFLAGRMAQVMIRTRTRGTKEERENRAKTLVGVFHNTAATILYGGGALILLQEFGVPVGPLLGGAAIAGVAIAFGAQRLVRDYFHGFVILLENQYGINDVIRIGGVSGLVERITMRMTVLRDIEGCVHFVPNGEITTVTNMTHGWSRALFEIGVAYKEDADRVMEILVKLGKELREDPEFSYVILDDLQMLGLDAMADSAIVFKFFIKTRPLQQWTVKREMLRRIKKKFDELGIEIPFPHRTVYMRSEDTPAPDGSGS